tara:strand:- start:1084 stop:2214 length:1131 start_codon:yes stop_codon:yes gene_type:complete
MANSKLLKEAIADAKAVRETAIANAKIALEEAFTPKLQSILSKKLQSEMAEEEEDEVEEVAEEVASSDIGKGGEPKYDEAHTELDPETEKETAAPGEEDSNVDKVDDLKEGEDSEEEVEETVSEGDDSEEEVDEVNEEEDSEEEANEGYHEDDEDEVDEELNLEDIIKELESELSEEEGDEEEVEEGEHGEEEMSHGEEEGMHGEEEGEHGEEEIAGEDEVEEDIDLDEILKEMGYGEEEDSEEEVEESTDNQVEELNKELGEAYATVKELKRTINEVNLLNAKLLYANKLFRSYAMNNDQKSKVVETLDRTKSVREVKLVFATLAESMKFGGETKKVRVTEGIASKAQASTAPKKEIISESNEIANRFKKLANIK